MSTSFLHERQHLGHCAVHTINNLCQEHWMTYDDFRVIAHRLHADDIALGNAPSYALNSYRSLIPLWGCFDIVVVIAALKLRQLRLSEHITLHTWQSRKTAANDVVVSPEILATVFGIIIHRSERRFMGLLNSQHWYAIAKVGSGFVNLDSKLQQPAVFTSESILNKYLRQCLEQDNYQVFLVSGEAHCVDTGSGNAAETYEQIGL
jgi:hypothetical protein